MPRTVSQSGRNRRQSRRCFTLVELLAVVAVIAALLALLVPVLRRAREAGNNVVCISQLRQLGLAVHLYQTDFDGWYPPAYAFVYFADAIKPYFPQYKTLRCPSITPVTPGAKTYAPQCFGGGMGWQNRGPTGRNWERFNIRRFGPRLRMGGFRQAPAYPDETTGEVTFSPAVTWNMDPVDVNCPYIVETNGLGNWTGLTYGGADVMVFPHLPMRTNYVTAGLGVASMDFSRVSGSLIAMRLYTDPSQMWFRVYPNPDWPWSTVRVCSPNLFTPL